MFVPAESMIASTPHVSSPSRDHSGSGKVPWAPRSMPCGVASSVHRSSIPPVPNVIFARPRTTQFWPTSDACWSPRMPAIGGAPGRTVASPQMPTESTTVGKAERGTANASSTSSFQSDPSTRRNPLVVADAFV